MHRGGTGEAASRESGATFRSGLAGRPDADVQAQSESGEQAEQRDPECESDAHENFHSRHLSRRVLRCLERPSYGYARVVVACFQLEQETGNSGGTASPRAAGRSFVNNLPKTWENACSATMPASAKAITNGKSGTLIVYASSWRVIRT